jgi:hypothetical protein
MRALPLVQISHHAQGILGGCRKGGAEISAPTPGWGIIWNVW